MSRELVRIGDAEVVVGDFLWGESTRPTDVEFRAYILEGSTKKYDDGTAFVLGDATLARTFTGGIGYTTYTYPAYALDKEVRLEATPIGFAAEVPDAMKTPEEDSRWVLANLDDDQQGELEQIIALLENLEASLLPATMNFHKP